MYKCGVYINFQMHNLMKLYGKVRMHQEREHIVVSEKLKNQIWTLLNYAKNEENNNGNFTVNSV